MEPSPLREEAAYGVICYLDDNAHTATVTGVPIGPFLGWQHGLLTPIAMSRLAVFCRRAAFEKGWLDPLTKNFFNFTPAEDNANNSSSQTPSSESDTRVTLTSQNTQQQQQQQQCSMMPSVTVFIVSMDIQLEPSTMRRRLSWLFQGRDQTDGAQLGIAEADLMIAAVGSSSFSLYGELFARPANAAPKTQRVRLGSVQLAYVQIDVAARRPLALLPHKKAALLGGLSQERLARAGAKPIVRLALDVLLQSFQRTSTTTSTTTAESEATPASSVLWRSVMLRMADMDFNLHLNQSMYQQFALDALKESVFDALVGSLRNNNVSACAGAAVVTPAMRVVLGSRLQESVGTTGTVVEPGKEGDALRALAAAAGAKEDPAALLREAHMTALQLDACVVSLHIEYANEIPLSMLSFVTSGEDGAQQDALKLWVALSPVTTAAATDDSTGEAEFYFAVMHPSHYKHGTEVTKKAVAACGTVRLRCGTAVSLGKL